MSSSDSTYAPPATERRDEALENAFRRATDDTIVAPNTLQHALYPRLLTQDTGLLMQTGPCAGRLEAVFVPVMTALRDSSEQHQRLFLIVADDCLLDDYLYRLLPYVRALAVADAAPITIYAEDGGDAFCRRYLPDGMYESDVCDHPLDPEVSVVVARFTQFRALFFGSGGVHALPHALDEVTDILPARDLFYFDEAQGYRREEFGAFVRLVEFLFAEDMDVVVGTTTLPEACLEELSFFEPLALPDAQIEPARRIRFEPSGGDVLARMEEAVRTNYFQNSRVFAVLEDARDAESLYARLATLYPQNVYLYHADQPTAERTRIYAQLRELEKEGEGYLLVTDGKAISAADLDATVLVTGLCAPESLLHRAGRCNRRGEMPMGQIIVVGDADGYQGRPLPKERESAYVAALMRQLDAPFDPAFWKTFVV